MSTLKFRGFNILRLWEDELNKRPKHCANKIKKAINEAIS